MATKPDVLDTIDVPTDRPWVVAWGGVVTGGDLILLEDDTWVHERDVVDEEVWPVGRAPVARFAQEAEAAAVAARVRQEYGP